MRRSVTVLFFVYILCTPVFGNTARWQKVGLPAGLIYQIVPDRKNAALWFAIDDFELYRSDDFAHTWKDKGIHWVQQIAVHPNDPTVYVLSIYAGKTTIYRSNDSGQSFLKIIPSNRLIRSISLHPHLHGYLLGLTFGSNNLLVSTDGGVSWLPTASLNRIRPECDAPVSVNDVLVSPFNDSTIYAATLGPCFFSGVAISHDLGQHWEINLETDSDNWFHYDAAFPDRAFLQGFDKKLRILDQSGWHEVESGTYIQQLVSVPKQPNKLYTLNYQGFYLGRFFILVSEDGGRSWQKVPSALNGIYTLKAMDDWNEGLLAGTVGGGVYYRNSTNDWHLQSTGFIAGYVPVIARSPVGSDIYAVANNPSYEDTVSFLYGSHNGGKNWQDLTKNIGRPGYIDQIAVNPSDSKQVLTHFFETKKKRPEVSEILFSHDGGVSWQMAASGNAFYLQTNFVFDTQHPEVVYFLASGSVFKSTKGGLHPEKVLGGVHNLTKMLIDPHDPRTFYLAGFDGIFRSTDNLRTLQQVDRGVVRDYDGCVADDFVSLPQNGSFLVMSCNSEIFKTEDGGITWRHFSHLRQANNANGEPIRGVRLFPADSTGNHFFLINAFGLFESMDGAKTWSKINREFGNVRFYTMTDPKIRPFYVGTTAGVFKSQQ